MLVEIRKISFGNTGSELMLKAIIEEFTRRYGKLKFAMLPNRNASFYQRSKYGLYQKLRVRHPGFIEDLVGSIIPKKIRSYYGIVTDSELDVVIDASGFAYGDQWGASIAKETARVISYWKLKGIKVIMLPQALGPFKDPDLRAYFKIIVDKADLVYARDRISYNHATEVCGQKPNLRLARDFTNLVVPPKDNSLKKYKNCIALISNTQMIKKADSETAIEYKKFMAECIKILSRSSLQPFVLETENTENRKLSEEIVERSGICTPIIEENDPLKAKGIIGQCHGIISSRYHGIVNALSQGVPAIASGWSHKYKMVLEDYDFLEGYLPVKSSKKIIEDKLDILLRKDKHYSASKKIDTNARKSIYATKQMWSEIYSIINGRS